MVELEMILDIIKSSIIIWKIIIKNRGQRGRGHAQGHEISS